MPRKIVDPGTLEAFRLAVKDAAERAVLLCHGGFHKVRLLPREGSVREVCPLQAFMDAGHLNRAQAKKLLGTAAFEEFWTEYDVQINEELDIPLSPSEWDSARAGEDPRRIVARRFAGVALDLIRKIWPY